MTAVAELISGAPFLWGAAAGSVGLFLGYALRKRSPDWGLVWGAAVAAAFVATGLLHGGVIGTGPRGESIPVGQITVTLLAALFAAYGIQRLRPSWVGALAFAATIGGIWATVPDTERAAVLIGVTTALAWAWWPAGWASPRFAGSLAIGLLLAWVVFRGGEGRETGWIGAVGAMATLGWSAFALPKKPAGLILAGHVALVAVWSRWAGLAATSTTALAIGVSASLAVALALHLANRWTGPQG